jgi:iron complex outermembrane receptor protein
MYNSWIRVNRGYLANADKVRVRGAEVDASFNQWAFYFQRALSYTDGKYIKFTNATASWRNGLSIFKDVSGSTLPGVSKWAGSLGGEYTKSAKFFSNLGKFFVAIDSVCVLNFHQVHRLQNTW